MKRMIFATLLLALGCGGGASAPKAEGEHGDGHGDKHEEGEHVDEHADEHGEHGEGHEHDALPTRVKLSERVIAEAEIKTEPARLQVVAPVLIATGHVEADPGRTAQVSAKVTGVIEEVRFREGDFVKEGTVIAVVRAPGLGGLRADLASLQARKVSARRT
jgi:multidrug efflux pump subunit AcrA (membrane-fusion protein)